MLAAAGSAAVQPNDPAWGGQWAQRHVRMPDVWDITTGDPSVVIATIDTGANPIPDLADALVPGWDFVDNDPEAQDLNGHGTQVASVIAARGNNGVGMAGYCWQCKVMPIRVSGNPNMIAAGITYAVEHGARVIDISLTRPGSPHWAEESAVRYALDRGVVVIASAGNNGNEVTQYPAAYPGVLAVGRDRRCRRALLLVEPRPVGGANGAGMQHRAQPLPGRTVRHLVHAGRGGRHRRPAACRGTPA